MKHANEIYYDVPLVEILDKNIKKISQVLLATTITLILVAIILINSSIKISIYSKRLIIKTMQLVEQLKFYKKTIFNQLLGLGFYGTIIALSLSMLIYFVDAKYPELDLSKTPFK